MFRIICEQDKATFKKIRSKITNNIRDTEIFCHEKKQNSQKSCTFCLFNYADTLFLHKLFGDWILMPIFAAYLTPQA